MLRISMLWQRPAAKATKAVKIAEIVPAATKRSQKAAKTPRALSPAKKKATSSSTKAKTPTKTSLPKRAPSPSKKARAVKKLPAATPSRNPDPECGVRRFSYGDVTEAEWRAALPLAAFAALRSRKVDPPFAPLSPRATAVATALRGMVLDDGPTSSPHAASTEAGGEGDVAPPPPPPGSMRSGEAFYRCVGCDTPLFAARHHSPGHAAWPTFHTAGLRDDAADDVNASAAVVALETTSQLAFQLSHANRTAAADAKKMMRRQAQKHLQVPTDTSVGLRSAQLGVEDADAPTAGDKPWLRERVYTAGGSRQAEAHAPMTSAATKPNTSAPASNVDTFGTAAFRLSATPIGPTFGSTTVVPLSPGLATREGNFTHLRPNDARAQEAVMTGQRKRFGAARTNQKIADPSPVVARGAVDRPESTPSTHVLCRCCGGFVGIAVTDRAALSGRRIAGNPSSLWKDRW